MGLEDNGLNFFHFCCYAYWVEKNLDKDGHLYFSTVNDKVFKSKMKVTTEEINTLTSTNNLIIPFCKKHCLKAIEASLEEISDKKILIKNQIRFGTVIERMVKEALKRL